MFIWKHVEIAICFQGQPGPQWQIYRLLKTILVFTKHWVWEEKWKPIRSLKSPNLNCSGWFQQRQGQSRHESEASLLSLNLCSWPGAWALLRDGTARFVPALIPLDTSALVQDPPKHCFCHSIIRIVYPIRSMLLVKLEKMMVAAPLPCSSTSPKFWQRGNGNSHSADSLVAWIGGDVVAADEPSKLFPYRQDGLTPDCCSADSVFRPSSSAILFSTARQETALWEEPAETPHRAVGTCSWVTPQMERGILSLIWCPFGGQVYGEKDHFQYCDIFGDFKRKRQIKIACSGS